MSYILLVISLLLVMRLEPKLLPNALLTCYFNACQVLDHFSVDCLLHALPHFCIYCMWLKNEPFIIDNIFTFSKVFGTKIYSKYITNM